MYRGTCSAYLTRRSESSARVRTEQRARTHRDRLLRRINHLAAIRRTRMKTHRVRHVDRKLDGCNDRFTCAENLSNATAAYTRKLIARFHRKTVRQVPESARARMRSMPARQEYLSGYVGFVFCCDPRRPPTDRIDAIRLRKSPSTGPSGGWRSTVRAYRSQRRLRCDSSCTESTSTVTRSGSMRWWIP